MKLTTWILLVLNLFLASTLITTSCIKDADCPTPVCLNNGTADGCNCDCPSGTSGDRCQYKDFCYGSNCQNGGFCNPNTGKCTCPPEYTGTHCETPRTPKSFTISRITISKWPLQNPNGSPWDSGSYPDIYPTLILGSTPSNGSGAFSLASNYANEVPPSGYICVWDITKTIDQLSSNWTIGIYDYDPNSADDLMGYIKFKPISKASGFPTEITFETSEARVTFKGKWNF